MPAVERVRKFCVRNILLVSAFLQGCVLLLLIVLEQDKITDPDKIDHSVVNACIVTQVAQCALVMATSFRVVRKINSKSITPYFLISSYLSSALLFGGIFFMLFLLDSSAFQFPDTREEDNTTDITLHRALFRFLYFSFVGQTSLGFGDIIPSSTITRVVVMTQLLLNVVYTFVILGLGLSSIQKKPLSPSYSSPHSGYHRSVSSGAEAYRIQRSSSGVGGGSDQTEIGDGLGDGSGVEKKSSAASGAICAVAELNAQRGGYSMAHMLPELDGSARYQGNRSHQRQVSHLAVTAMQLEYETDSSDEEYDRDVGVTHALSMQNRL